MDKWVVGFDGFIGALMGENNGVYGVYSRNQQKAWDKDVIDMEAETGYKLTKEGEYDGD